MSKSQRGEEKEGEVAVNAGWHGICSQYLAPVVEGEKRDVTL
jgi:hypothetical protein